jgi:hypothetical protein
MGSKACDFAGYRVLRCAETNRPGDTRGTDMTARQFSILMVCAFAFAAGCSSSSSDSGASIAESTATVAGTTAPVPGSTPEPAVTPEPSFAPEPSVSENLYGVWLTPDNLNHLSFNEDDTWSFSHAEDPVDDFKNRGFGPFTFDGELLTLFTDPASNNCSPNSGAFTEVITGTYEAAITPEGNLELTDVDDLCVPRKVEFRGVLSSPEKLHQRGTLEPYSP